MWPRSRSDCASAKAAFAGDAAGGFGRAGGGVGGAAGLSPETAAGGVGLAAVGEPVAAGGADSSAIRLFGVLDPALRRRTLVDRDVVLQRLRRRGTVTRLHQTEAKPVVGVGLQRRQLRVPSIGDDRAVTSPRAPAGDGQAVPGSRVFRVGGHGRFILFRRLGIALCALQRLALGEDRIGCRSGSRRGRNQCQRRSEHESKGCPGSVHEQNPNLVSAKPGRFLTSVRQGGHM